MQRLARAMYSFCFFNDTATTEIYTLSLHDALPISSRAACASCLFPVRTNWTSRESGVTRSEEHTSELQSRFELVCRLLLEKKKKKLILRIPLLKKTNKHTKL